MAINERTLRRGRRTREEIAGIIERLAGELNDVAARDDLNEAGTQQRALTRYRAAEEEIAGLIEGIESRADTNLATAQSALDEHLAVDDDKLATRATIYSGLLARAHDHTDEVLKVLAAQYGDPITRRLLLQALAAVEASLEPQGQKVLQQRIEAIKTQGAGQISAREAELTASVNQARDFVAYVDTIRHVTNMALREFTAGHAPDETVAPGVTIPGDPYLRLPATQALSTARMILTRTEAPLAAFEDGRPNWRRARAFAPTPGGASTGGGRG